MTAQTFRKYHKIDSVFKRDDRGQFLLNQFTCPEFEYLAENPWYATEKVDGTNMRVHLSPQPYATVLIGGRTDDAQIPVYLYQRMLELFGTDPIDVLEKLGVKDSEVTLYGEGFGAKIQKGGGNYIADGVDFVLFDVQVGNWWLLPHDVRDVAAKLGLQVVQEMLPGEYNNLNSWINIIADVDNPLHSAWGSFPIEGVVLTPQVPLWNRRGERIITKIKYRDFVKR